METRQSLQQVILWKLENSMEKNETGHNTQHTVHNNKFKIIEIHKCEIGNLQNPRGECLWHWL